MAADPDDLAEIDLARSLLDGKGLDAAAVDAGDGAVRVVVRNGMTGALAYTSPSTAVEVRAWREALVWAGLGPGRVYCAVGRPLVVDGEARVAPLARGKGAA